LSFVLKTSRLLIRPLESEDFASYQELVRLSLESTNNAPAEQLFEWYRLSSSLQAMLYQPPYGDRALILTSTNELIGVAGFVPCLDFFGLIPELQVFGSEKLKTPEIGLFYAVHPDHQRQGYATEAASALIDYAFQSLKLKRLIATTRYENVASQGVMKKLGMKICRNPFPEPEWLQIVGFVENVRPD
jgi:ribosomal-protein-alanine N-acetyltransferase